MAIVQSPEKKNIEESKEKEKYKVIPRYSAWLNEDIFVLEVSLPGVSKENIKMKALEDYFTLRAERENIVYTLDLDLSFKIEPGKIGSNYNEGLLKVEFERFDPLAHAYALIERKQDDEKEKEYYKVYPRIYRRIDNTDKAVTLELSIPGVSEDNIEIKVRPTWFYLSAVRPEEKVEYAASQNFGVEIVPEKTTFDYFQGLLKIKAMIRYPLDNAKEIKF